MHTVRYPELKLELELSSSFLSKLHYVIFNEEISITRGEGRNGSIRIIPLVVRDVLSAAEVVGKFVQWLAARCRLAPLHGFPCRRPHRSNISGRITSGAWFLLAAVRLALPCWTTSSIHARFSRSKNSPAAICGDADDSSIAGSK